MKKLLTIVWIFGVISLGSFANAQDNFSCTISMEYLDQYFQENQEDIYDTSDIIDSFCDFALADNVSIILDWWSSETYEKPVRCENDDYSWYDASESLFVNYLCGNVNNVHYEKVDSVFDEGSGVLKLNTFADLWYRTYSMALSNLCNNKYSMNDCDVWWNNKDLMQMILNDYFNIMQAKLYYVDDLDTDSTEIINNFSKNNFMWTILCDPAKSPYTNTCDMMQDYVRNARNLIKNTELVDVEALGNQWGNINCDDIWREDYSFLYCGLVGSESLNEVHFINLVYNELFWLKVFNNFHQNILLGKNYTRFLDRETSSLKASAALLEQKKYVAKNINAINELELWIEYSFDTLFEIGNTFSYHIGLLMYQEDLYNLRWVLAKLYSPIITLNDKLRNVQDANS